MEVPPPEHGIRSGRDFLVHMGTITLGLLIALGLEHAAELLHERQLLHTAARNLTSEARGNRSLSAADQVSLTPNGRAARPALRALEVAPAHAASLPDLPIHCGAPPHGTNIPHLPGRQTVARVAWYCAPILYAESDAYADSHAQTQSGALRCGPATLPLGKLR